MGKKYRTAKAADTYVPPTGIVARQMDFDTSAQDNQYLGGNADSYGPTVPGQFELSHAMAQARMATYPSLQPSVKDLINYEVGGQRGEVDGLPYSTGVVSSDLVENFALTGEQAEIRRGYNQSSTGPVGTSDHNAMLAMAYAQSVNQFYPNEASQADVIAAL